MEGDLQDDQPTYVLEDSRDTLSKAEYNDLVEHNDKAKEKKTDLPLSEEEISSTAEDVKQDAHLPYPARTKEHAATIGGSTKRRLAKIYGDDGDELPRSESEDSAPQTKKSKAKKTKKVKLCFDDGTLEG